MRPTYPQPHPRRSGTASQGASTGPSIHGPNPFGVRPPIYVLLRRAESMATSPPLPATYRWGSADSRDRLRLDPTSFAPSANPLAVTASSGGTRTSVC